MVNHDQAVIMGIAGLLVLAVLITGVVILSASADLQGSGSVTTAGLVKVYADEAMTKEISGISWGDNLPVGSVVTVTLWVWNTASYDSIVSSQTYGWNPAIAGNYLTVTNAQEGTVIPADTVKPCDFTLAVSPNASGFTAFSSVTKITLTQVSG